MCRPNLPVFSILPDAGQIMTLRPETAPRPSVTLDAPASRLLSAVLDEIARDATLPIGAARQAALRAFARTAATQ